MSLQQIRKEIESLKQSAASELKKKYDYDPSHLTDEELRQAIAEDIRSLGFESEEEFYESAKKFILEKDENANVTHVFAISARIFEMFKDFNLFEEFIKKYSSLELTE